MFVRWGPTGWRFLISEVPLYQVINMANYKTMGSTITDAYFVGASGTDAATCKVPTLSLTHTHTFSLSLTHTLSLSLSLSHTLSLSLTHTHTLSLTHAHTHTLSLSHGCLLRRRVRH